MFEFARTLRMRSNPMRRVLSCAAMVACMQLAHKAALADPPVPSYAPGASAAGESADAGGSSALELTAAEARRRAVAQSPLLLAQQAKLNEAEAKFREARLGYLPRVGLSARYARLSNFDAPALGSGGTLVGTADAPGTPNPRSVALAPLSFANILNQFSLQANLVVPISDYFLRIGKAQRALGHASAAARWDALVASHAVAAEAEIVYYQWLRARAALSVAQQSLLAQQGHLRDAEALVEAQVATKLETERAAAEVASATQNVVHARSLLELSEANLRMRIRLSDAARLDSAEQLGAAPSALPAAREVLVRAGLAARPELRSLAENLRATESQRDLARAARYPQVSAFADATMANPNPRYQPQADKWLGTWALGAQLTWSPTEAYTSIEGAAVVDARSAALSAEVQRLQDGIALEIHAAWLAAREADEALVNGAAQVRAAAEAARIAGEIYRSGKSRDSQRADAELQLTAARLGLLSAQVDARIYRVRLRLALGAD